MKLKRIIASILSVCMLAAAAASAGAIGYGEEWDGEIIPSVNYKDVPSNHWAYENIARSTAKNWFSGYPDGTFRPKNSINRAEAIKVFVTFLGLKLKDTVISSYYDVSPSDWYSPYVEAGKDLLPQRVSIQGMIPFQPKMPITREDTVYALVKSLGYDSKVKFVDQSVLNMFSDQNSISNSIKPYVAFAVQEGLVSGYTNGTFGGQDPLNRAEFATLLYRASMHGFNDTKSLKSVSVTPSSREMKIGESFTISATANYTDGSSEAISSLGAYNADSNGVVSISGKTVTAKTAGVCEIKFNNESLSGKSVFVSVSKPEGVPTITLNTYSASTTESTVTLSGTVTDSSGSSVTLTCNGKTVDVDSKGKFSVTFPLSIGNNDFEFVAQNEYGSPALKNISITRNKVSTPSSDDDDDDNGSEVSPLLPDDNDSDDKKDPDTNPNPSSDGYNYTTAINIGTNDVATGSLGYTLASTGELDRNRWYRLSMPSDGVLSLSYIAEASLYTYVRLYDKNGNSQIGYDYGRDKMLTLSKPLQAGTYYIRLDRNDGSGTYTLKTSSTFQSSGTDDETKGDYISANSISMGNTANGHLGYISDQNKTDKTDWWTFTNPNTGTVNISFVGNTDLDVYLRLFAMDGSKQINYTYGKNKTLNISKELTPGTYYIRVDYNSGYGPYTLSLS